MRKEILLALAGTLTGLLAALTVESALTSRPQVWLGGPTTYPVLIATAHEDQLARRGIHHGEVEVTLEWDNRNDLDLHVIDPSGECVFFGHRQARSGGALDVDANAGSVRSDPVEHVYWPYGTAPDGIYRVFVHHFHNHGDRDPTPFRLQVSCFGQISRFVGLAFPKQGMHANRVCSFTVDASARQVRAERPRRHHFWAAVLLVAAWTGLLGMFAGMGILLAELVYLRRRTFPTGQPIRALGLGALTGVVAGGVAQIQYALVSGTHGTNLLFRSAGWLVLGGLLGCGLARAVPYLPVRRAMRGGVVGAAIAVASFMILSMLLGDGFGRMTGAVILGVAIALMVVLPELVGGAAWSRKPERRLRLSAYRRVRG